MKKKYLLAAVNAKYIHSNPAVYCLKSFAAAKGQRVEVAEYTINQKMEDILKDLYIRQADVAAFSCYIWNIELIGRLVRNLKKICPQTELWLGGPEVSYQATQVLKEFPQVTGVMVGEGEETFSSLIAAYEGEQAADGVSLKAVKGIVYRVRESLRAWDEAEQGKTEQDEAEQGKTEQDKAEQEGEERIVEQLPAIVPDFSRLPFLYGDSDLSHWNHRILYYESSRGCPFSCSYCLSSVEKRVRFRDMDLVKQELLLFLEQKVARVKFIDRTFNANHQRTKEIWTFIREHDNGITNFHFEIEAELLDREEIRLLTSLRPGLVKVEIGVQTTNRETLRAVNRSTELEAVKQAARQLLASNNVHVHLDLIAGLPKEDLSSFIQSFNEVFLLFPHELQLGFLKVLYGAPIAKAVREQELIYQEEPPYEVLSTKWLSYADVLRLKAVCEMLEVYYNSGQFIYSVRYLLHFFSSPFEFFDRLAAFYKRKGYEGKNHTRGARYDILLEFAKEALNDAGIPGAEKEASNDAGIPDAEKEASNGAGIPDAAREGLLFEVSVLEELLLYDLCLRDKLRVRPEYGMRGQMSREQLRECYADSRISGQERGMHHIEAFSFDPVQTARMGRRTGMACRIVFSYEKREPMYGQATEWRIPPA